MSRRWKLLIAGGILTVLLGASMVINLRVHPASELDAYKKLLRDQGEKLELSQVLPPPVAPESNAVEAVQQAFDLIGSGDVNVPQAMKMVALGKALIGWNQPDVRGSGAPAEFTNSWDDFASEVEADRPAIELLHQVLVRPKLEFQIDETKDIFQQLSTNMTVLALSRRSAQKLVAVSILELHRGDTAAATTNILTLLALVRNNAADGLLISHLVRIAITENAVSPTWELLQATNVTDSQLAAVQAGWQQMDFLSDADNAFTMERAWSLAMFQKWRVEGMGGYAGTLVKPVTRFISGGAGGGWSFELDLDELAKNTRAKLGEAMWRSSWSFTDELYQLKRHQIFLETLRALQTNRTGYYKADYDAMSTRLMAVGGATHAGAAYFRALKIPDFHELQGIDLGSILRKTLRAGAARGVTVTAIALKRYQLAHSTWPQTLAELMPDFLPQVPIDPYDGKPLRYHPNADGTFLLYCIGEDGVDNGGDPSSGGGYVGAISSSLDWLDSNARDWVWPQPATPAEIQYFREHPPK